MCLSTTLEKENKRFNRLAVKLRNTNNGNSRREEKVARAIVSVLSHRSWLAGKNIVKGYLKKNDEYFDISINYKSLIDIMRKELIPKLPRSVQYRVYF